MFVGVSDETTGILFIVFHAISVAHPLFPKEAEEVFQLGFPVVAAREVGLLRCG